GARLFGHRGGDIHVRLRPRGVGRDHHENARRNRLPSELEPVHRRRQGAELFKLFAGAEIQRLTRTDRGAHRLPAHTRPVVAHVALHHDLAIFVDLRNAERAGQDAIPAGDAARLARRLDDTVTGPLDRVGRTHFRTGRLFTMHADDGHGLRAAGAVDEL